MIGDELEVRIRGYCVNVLVLGLGLRLGLGRSTLTSREAYTCISFYQGLG